MPCQIPLRRSLTSIVCLCLEDTCSWKTSLGVCPTFSGGLAIGWLVGLAQDLFIPTPKPKLAPFVNRRDSPSGPLMPLLPTGFGMAGWIPGVKSVWGDEGKE